MKIRKPAHAFVLLIFLLVLMTSVAYVSYYVKWKIVSNEKDTLKLDGVVITLNMIDENTSFLANDWENKIDMLLDLMRAVYRNLPETDDYEALEVLGEEGVVLRIANNKIIYPEYFSGRFPELTAEELRNGLDEATYDLEKNGEGEPKPFMLKSVQISEDAWYIEMSSEDEWMNTVYPVEMYNSVIEDTAKNYNGYLFMISEEDPEADFIYKSKAFDENVKNFADLGIDQQDIDERKDILYYQNLPHETRYVNMTYLGVKVLVILMLDSSNDIEFSLISIILVILLTFIFMTAFIFWLYLVQKYVQTHDLSEIQKQNYHPKHIQKITISMGLVGTIVGFIICFSIQLIGNLYYGAISDQNSVEILKINMSLNEGEVSSFEQQEEKWSIYFAERAALLLEIYPELKTHAFLAEASEILNTYYIMLYDENGNEELSSNDFVKFTLGTDDDDPTTDFRRLLMGTPSIIHAPEIERTTGQYVQMFGTRFPLENGNYGALILTTIDPEQRWLDAESSAATEFFQSLTLPGDLSLGISLYDHKIFVSSDPGLVGMTDADAGLDTGENTFSALDVFGVKGKIYYGSYDGDEYCRYFHLTENTFLNSLAVPFAGVVALCFAVNYIIISVYMLSPYKSDEYEEMVKISEKSSRVSFENEEEGGNNSGDKNLNMKSTSSDLKNFWNNMEPKGKVIVLLQSMLLLVLIAAVHRFFDTSSILSFMLRGNWKHGFNIMALAGIIILTAFYILFVLLKNFLNRLSDIILDSKGLTLWKLSMSLMNYAAIVILLFYIFSFLGFNTNVLLASAGILSLAVSLGSRDLVADILAGIFLVFESDFTVGDIIEINGFRGRVLEIGVRNTRLIGVGDNVKIIGNQNVKNVLNMSILNSWFVLELHVPADQPLPEIESMLKAELPKIGAKIPEVISGPTYKGVWSIAKGENTLSVVTECHEENLRRVQRDVNRAVRLLFDEKGYRLN